MTNLEVLLYMVWNESLLVHAEAAHDDVVTVFNWYCKGPLPRGV